MPPSPLAALALALAAVSLVRSGVPAWHSGLVEDRARRTPGKLGHRPCP